jgi:hypothetical protein
MRKEEQIKKNCIEEEINMSGPDARERIASNDRNIARLKEIAPPDKNSEQLPQHFLYHRKLLALEQMNMNLKSLLSETEFDKYWKRFIIHFKNSATNLVLALRSIGRKKDAPVDRGN